MTTILGLGCDLLRIERIARIGVRHGKLLLERVLAPAELDALAGVGAAAADWPGCAPKIAGLIASKEAFFKALGTGLVVPLRWSDVAVGGCRASPTIALSGAAATACEALEGMASRLALGGNDVFVHATVILFGRTASAANRQAESIKHLPAGDQNA